ncbi:hypothetical protein CBM2585_A60225 [Cupriavidus taiwanensis]|nr:hypothetical protein CBM2585_A60225 [Cupriavidus taiwanensis]
MLISAFGSRDTTAGPYDSSLMVRHFLPLLISAVLSACAGSPLNGACTPQRDTLGRISRSHAAVAEFKRLNPCPANGGRSGPCPGYVVDHVIPLCNCGADEPGNMQWQTIADAKAKDRRERQICSAPSSST